MAENKMYCVESFFPLKPEQEKRFWKLEEKDYV